MSRKCTYEVSRIAWRSSSYEYSNRSRKVQKRGDTGNMYKIDSGSTTRGLYTYYFPVAKKSENMELGKKWIKRDWVEPIYEPLYYKYIQIYIQKLKHKLVHNRPLLVRKQNISS